MVFEEFHKRNEVAPQSVGETTDVKIVMAIDEEKPPCDTIRRLCNLLKVFQVEGKRNDDSDGSGLFYNSKTKFGHGNDPSQY